MAMITMAVIMVLVLAPISFIAAFRISAWARGRFNGFFLRSSFAVVAVIAGLAAYFSGEFLFTVTWALCGLITTPDEGSQLGNLFGHSVFLVFLSIVAMALRGMGVGVSPKKPPQGARCQVSNPS
jgi:amino acid transporter